MGLHERHELAVDDLTDAAGDLADLGQRLIESEAGEQRTVVGQIRRRLGEGQVGRGAVVVVGVEHAERAGDLGGSGQHGVAGAPRLRPLRAVGVLQDVRDVEVGMLVCDVSTHVRLDVGPHDQHDLVHAGGQGVLDCEVEKRLAVSADDSELLGTTEPGAEPGGHDDEGEAHAAIVGVSVRADGERDGSR